MTAIFSLEIPLCQLLLLTYFIWRYPTAKLKTTTAYIATFITAQHNSNTLAIKSVLGHAKALQRNAEGLLLHTLCLPITMKGIFGIRE